MKENKLFLIVLACSICIGIILGFIVRFSISDCTNSAQVSNEILKTSDNNQLSDNQIPKDQKIIFLHHSTGQRIWDGGVKKIFSKYNARNNTNYQITEQAFPKKSPYGWNNYPYDYWNIWVRNAGVEKFKKEPTLEILSEKYDVIIFKHCYPVSNIKKDEGKPDISSKAKKLENYKLQYKALKKKLRKFPDNKFIIWTGAALVKKSTTEKNAERAKEFFDWVRDEWDEPGDNIFLWDFYELETEGGLYLKQEYASGKKDSHPNKHFSLIAAPFFSHRIIRIIEGKGDSSSLTGV